MSNKKTLIIAEAGVNHNGSLTIAKDLIRTASQCGADYVKFQTFKADSLTSQEAMLADYQKNSVSGKTQHKMLLSLELKHEWHSELIETAKSEGIKFLTTSFDIESTKFVKKLNLGLFKIPSGEITNLPYLKLIGSYKQQVILSTGMATMDEIKAAINILENAGTSRSKITLLHCTSEYPAPFNEINLSAMETLRKSFNINVGYSDHTVGIAVSIAAVGLGATIIEKHFTLNRSLDGPDHKASLEPSELEAMIKAIREVEISIGTPIKKPTPSEMKNRKIARKSIVAKVPIQKGEALSLRNLDVKRPGDGLSPMIIENVIGRIAIRNFRKDEQIEI